jgi:hypothetical protein
MNNQLNSEVISADNDYKNRLQTLQDQLSEMQRTVAQQNRAATVAKQADYDKQASKISQALTSRGVGQLEIDRQLRELKDEIFAPVVAQSAQQNQALNEARTQLMASTRSLMEANDSQKASIRNKYTAAIQSIKQERGISDSKKQESIMNLRAKLIDDLRATEQNFVNQQNTLQTQYNNAENRALTAADMIGVLNGLNTVRRDTLNESARKTDINYAEGQQRLALAAAKLSSSRGGGATSQVDVADLTKQAMQLQAIDPSISFGDAVDKVINTTKKGVVGQIWQNAINNIIGTNVSKGTIPADNLTFNNNIDRPTAYVGDESDPLDFLTQTKTK